MDRTDDRSPGDDALFDPAFVAYVFDRCSPLYIRVSTIASFGMTERWRRACVAALDPLPEGAVGYDLMAGTGEVWPHLLRAHPGIARITAIDISEGMHARALERLHAMRADRIGFVRADVLREALPEAGADFVVSTFGLKLLSREGQGRLAAAIARTLRPGGTFSLIEASDPRGWWLRPLYRAYLGQILPAVERVLLRGATDFRLLHVYTERFGSAAAFAEDLRAHGLEVRLGAYVGGCATGVSGCKPAARHLDPAERAPI